jgi:hypothetical protein
VEFPRRSTSGHSSVGDAAEFALHFLFRACLRENFLSNPKVELSSRERSSSKVVPAQPSFVSAFFHIHNLLTTRLPCVSKGPSRSCLLLIIALTTHPRSNPNACDCTEHMLSADGGVEDGRQNAQRRVWWVPEHSYFVALMGQCPWWAEGTL